MKPSRRKCLFQYALIVLAASAFFPLCQVPEIQTQTSPSIKRNLTITILLDSESYEEFAAWIAPYGQIFHNFTFIIDNEQGSFHWFLGNQTRIDFVTGIGEVIPLLGAVKPGVHTKGFIQVEAPENRVKIVQAAVDEWRSSIGYVPCGVFMFQPDTVVSNYLKSQNISYILGYCFEQYTVDWMTMRGGWQLPYYANSVHALMPENQSIFGALVLPWLTWDWVDSLTLSHNYDTHIIDTRDSQLTLENRTEYIIQLIEENLASCSPVAYSAFSFEFDWLSEYAKVDSSIFDDVTRIFNYFMGNNSCMKLSAGNFTRWFTNNYDATPAYFVSFSSPHSGQSVEWFCDQRCRVARTNGTVVSFVDYTRQQEDKYLQTNATVNFSQPRSPINCIDNSLSITIDGFGGGMYRSPIKDEGVAYEGNLPDFMTYYYSNLPGQGTVPHPFNPTFPILPSSNPISPKPTITDPQESPPIPESIGLTVMLIAFIVLTIIAFISKIGPKYCRAKIR